MTEREIAELRRRFRADKSNITHVRGCYVNENREVISEFDQSIAMMGQEESEKLLANLRRKTRGISILPCCAAPCPVPWGRTCWTSDSTHVRWRRERNTGC